MVSCSKGINIINLNEVRRQQMKEVAIQVMVLYHRNKRISRSEAELKAKIAREVNISVSLVDLVLKANGGMI